MLRWLHRRFWPALKTSVQRWGCDQGSLHSAALAYCAAFSLFPLCLTLVAVLGFVARVSGRVQFRQQQLLDLVREHLGLWFTEQLQSILLGVRNQAIVGGPVGLVALAIACLAIFVQLQSMFDSVWRPADSHAPNWLRTIWTVVRQRLIAFLMLLGVGGLLIALFTANMVLAWAKFSVSDEPILRTV